MIGSQTFEKAKYRLDVLKHWMSGRRNGVSGRELLRFLTERTSFSRGKAMVEDISRQGTFFEVRLKGIEHPLYYPSELPLSSLYIPLSQLFHPGDWHAYEISRTEVRPDDVVIDCGSAEGLFSLCVSGRCSKAYAIEPLPRFVEALELTFKDIPNVEVVPCALSDRRGEGYLSQEAIGSALGGDEEGAVAVRLNTMDNLFYRRGRRIDYIKADVEGSEMELLRGGEQTIRQYRPRIAITTYHREKHAEEIEAFLLGLNVGYETLCKGIEGEWGAPKMLHAWT